MVRVPFSQHLIATVPVRPRIVQMGLSLPARPENKRKTFVCLRYLALKKKENVVVLVLQVKKHSFFFNMNTENAHSRQPETERHAARNYPAIYECCYSRLCANRLQHDRGSFAPRFCGVRWNKMRYHSNAPGALRKRIDNRRRHTGCYVPFFQGLESDRRR